MEHFLVFLVTGIVTILLLAILSYSTTKNLALNEQGINFLLNEAHSISIIIAPFSAFIFLLLWD